MQSSEKNLTLWNKVPEITIFFWIIKVLCTTVGETASDFLNVNMGFGLIGTAIAMGIVLLVALFFQFRSQKYIPVIYWLTVVLVSVFGTLVTDIMTDSFRIPLEMSTLIFSILLSFTFLAWYMKEKTLSIHSIFTKRRELFYWLAILFTFALGTATGDLMAESLSFGYATTGMIIVAIVAIFSIAWRLWLNSILSFWIIYIMTRPLGASLGDYLSQPTKYGWLWLGATVTSVIFLSAIFLTIIFLSVSKKDTIVKEEIIKVESGWVIQTVIVLCLFVLISGIGYSWRHTVLQSETQNISMQVSQGTLPSDSLSASGSHPITQKIWPLGDVSIFRTITQDTLNLVNSGNLDQAMTRVGDLEHEWDIAQSRLKALDQTKWTEVDGAIDKVLRQLRAVNPNSETCKTALKELLKALD